MIGKMGSSADAGALEKQRIKALFIFCRELPEKRRKGNAKILGRKTT